MMRTSHSPPFRLFGRWALGVTIRTLASWHVARSANSDALRTSASPCAPSPRPRCVRGPCIAPPPSRSPGECPRDCAPWDPPGGLPPLRGDMRVPHDLGQCSFNLGYLCELSTFALSEPECMHAGATGPHRPPSLRITTPLHLASKSAHPKMNAPTGPRDFFADSLDPRRSLADKPTHQPAAVYWTPTERRPQAFSQLL